MSQYPLSQTLSDLRHGPINRRIFTDNDIYKQELEQVFGRSWLFVAHESQAAKPNDFVASYIGEDPVLVTRDSKGKLHTFLNMQRHRGNRICRADAGNAPSFMCTYHGWTFATDGKLVGVPGYKEAYFEELDRSQWGLVEAGTETYKGLVFGNWDGKALSLMDYLGDATWYMDCLLERHENGTGVLSGTHRWVLNANWKLGADNFGGDNYHFPITHGASLRRGSGSMLNNVKNKVNVVAGDGHGILGRYAGSGQDMQWGSARESQEYFESITASFKQRLGENRARQASFGVATIFPNFTWHSFGAHMIRVWHPRGPEKMEVWSYCVVDKKMPQVVKDQTRAGLTRAFGPSSALEQDDMNNWLQTMPPLGHTLGRIIR